MSETIIEKPTYKVVERTKTHFRKRLWYIGQGVLFILAGALALALPVTAVITIELLLAFLLLACGLYQLYQSKQERSLWMALSGVLSIVLGAWMLIMPVTGAVAVATLIALFLLAEGFAEVGLAFYWRKTFNYWSWLLLSGLLSVGLGILLLIGWPDQTLTLAGIYLGVNFILYGLAILVITLKNTQDKYVHP